MAGRRFDGEHRRPPPGFFQADARGQLARKEGHMRIKARKLPEKTVRPSKGRRLLSDIRKNWQLHLLLLVPIIYEIIFDYFPMYGAQIAFRQFRAKDGILGSKWVGLKWFTKFLTNYEFKSIFTNTLILSLYSIAVSFVLAVSLALLLNTVRNERFKRFTQSIAYMPHFISVVVLVSIVNQVFNPVNGLYGTVYRFLGGDGYPHDFRSLASSFRHMYVWSGVWQNLGWDSIIYVAALSSVSQDLHEAAMIDGATRWKRVLHVDLPSILPTACIMLIMRCGRVLGVGFQKVYLMQTALNQTTSEVISTYVFKVGMGSSSDFSYGAAIGLFNSAVNCILLILVNWISRRLSNREVSLF